MNRTTRLVLVLAFGVVVLAPGAWATSTYFIDECLIYSSTGGCYPADPDLNDVTSSLASAMSADGWGGNRYVDPAAWPQDFMESCSSNYGVGGKDYLYADAKHFAAFAGHGDALGYLYYSVPHDNACQIALQGHVRLGTMGGGQTGTTMWLTCGTLSNLIGVANTQNLWQQLGFGNNISIATNEPRDVYLATTTMSNRDAWFAFMSGRGRGPTVVSYSTASLSACWTGHFSHAIRRGIGLNPRYDGPLCNQAATNPYWCFEFVVP